MDDKPSARCSEDFERLSRGERARLWSARCRRWWSSIANSLHVTPHNEKVEEGDNGNTRAKDNVQKQETQKVKVEEEEKKTNDILKPEIEQQQLSKTGN